MLNRRSYRSTGSNPVLTARRPWRNGSVPAFQAGGAGSIPAGCSMERWQSSECSGLLNRRPCNLARRCKSYTFRHEPDGVIACLMVEVARSCIRSVLTNHHMYIRSLERAAVSKTARRRLVPCRVCQILTGSCRGESFPAWRRVLREGPG